MGILGKRKYTNLAMLWADYNKERGLAIDVMADYLELSPETVGDAFPLGSGEQFTAAQNKFILNHFRMALGGMVLAGSSASLSLTSLKTCEGIEQPQPDLSQCKSLIETPPELLGAGAVLGMSLLLFCLYSHLKGKQEIVKRAADNLMQLSQG